MNKYTSTPTHITAISSFIAEQKHIINKKINKQFCDLAEAHNLEI